MAKPTALDPPDISVIARDDGKRVTLSGAWTLDASRRLEEKSAQITTQSRGARTVALDLSRLDRLDTAGAFVLNRAQGDLEKAGVIVTVEGLRTEQRILLDEIRGRGAPPPQRRSFSLYFEILADLGEALVRNLGELYRGVSFLGEFVAALGRALTNPGNFRGTSLVYQMENFAFHSIPIIFMINLAVGAIIAQQGIFQLQRFGAVDYVVDLIGVLVLREMGVLLTSIMIAGRSGSAITAELGSMKVREEIDALRAMGLSPIDVLVVPRVLALMFSLPILTFIAEMAGLLGGLLVSWVYAGINPTAFLALLQTAIGLNTFMVGLIKSPFMALVIGVISTQDGLETSGSAESLGKQVTSAVVKSIFMVIIVDGFFAMFFASIHY